MKNKSGLLALLGAAFILGTFGVWIRILNGAFSNNGQVIARSGVALLIIASIVYLKRKSINFRFDKKLYKYLLGFGIVFPLSIISFTASVNQIKVSTGLFMLYIGSLIASYLWGRFAFKEKLSVNKIFSIGLLLIGLYVFVYPFTIEKINTGIVLGLLSGILEGSAHAFRKFMKDVPREVIVLFQSLSGVLVASLAALYSAETLIKDINPTALIAVLIFGASLVIIGYLLAYGFGHFDINVGGIILSTELFFAMVVSAMFLQEVPTNFELLGGILIFLGAITTSIDRSVINKTRKLLGV